jgi:hypothetical protein
MRSIFNLTTRIRQLLICFLFPCTLFAQLQVINNCDYTRYGLKNKKDSIVLPLKYRNISNISQNYWDLGIDGWIISDDAGHVGLVDANGRVLFEPVYKSITHQKYYPKKNILEEPRVAIVGKDSELIVLNKPPLHDLRCDGLACYSLGRDSIGFATTSGVILTPAIYSGCNYSDYNSSGKHLIRTSKTLKDGSIRYGYVDSKAKEFIPVKFDEASEMFKKGIFVKKGDQSWFVDYKGKYHKVMLTYKDVSYENGLYFVTDTIYEGTLGNKTGLLSPQGKLIAPAVYDSLKLWMPDNECLFYKNGKCGIINTKGKELLQECDYIEWPAIIPYCENYEEKNAKWKKQILRSYSHAHNLIFSKGGYFGVYSDSLGIIANAEYSKGGWVNEERTLFWGEKNNRIFFVDARSANPAPLSPDHFPGFNGQLSLNGDLLNVQCNATGEIIIEYPFSILAPFDSTQDLYVIEGPHGKGIFSDHVIVPPFYKNVEHYTGRLGRSALIYVRTFSRLCGAYTPEGVMIADTAYSHLTAWNPELKCLTGMQYYGYWDLIDEKGKIRCRSKGQFYQVPNENRLIISGFPYQEIYDLDSQKIIFDSTYWSIVPLRDHYYLGNKKNSRSEIIRYDGKKISSDSVTKALGPVNGYFLVWTRGARYQTNIIDTTGKWIATLPGENWGYFPMDMSLYFPPEKILKEREDFEFHIAGNHFMDSLGAAVKKGKVDGCIARNYLAAKNTQLSDLFFQSLYRKPESDEELIQNNTFQLVYFDEQAIFDPDYNRVVDFYISSVSCFYFTGGQILKHNDEKKTPYLTAELTWLINDSVIIPLRYAQGLFMRTVDLSPVLDSIRSRIHAMPGKAEFHFDCYSKHMIAPYSFHIDDSGLYLQYLDDKSYEHLTGVPPGPDNFATVFFTWEELKPYLAPEVVGIIFAERKCGKCGTSK